MDAIFKQNSTYVLPSCLTFGSGQNILSLDGVIQFGGSYWILMKEPGNSQVLLATDRTGHLVDVQTIRASQISSQYWYNLNQRTHLLGSLW